MANNGTIKACMDYMLNWNQCNGLPKISNWKITDRNLVLNLVDDTRKLVKLTTVFKTLEENK